MLPLVQTDSLPFPGPEARQINRTSMLVAAVLRTGTQALAIRIRNMSATGALIEGAALPLPGSRVELVRGTLRAGGQVAWADGRRCGVALDDPVAVDRWISKKVPAHQMLVDALVDAARNAPAPVPMEGAAIVEPASGMCRPDAAAGSEVDSIIASLAALGDRLTDNPAIVAVHLVELQAIDEAQQRLAALKRRLA